MSLFIPTDHSGNIEQIVARERPSTGFCVAPNDVRHQWWVSTSNLVPGFERIVKYDCNLKHSSHKIAYAELLKLCIALDCESVY